MSTFLNRLFNLQKGEDDKQKTLENVRVNISFSGANLWILVCAIIIASVGLNVNSTAVIIGAMLISPLMGPIVGAGFALGMFDFPLLKRSLKNLLIATLAGLLVSTLYFFLSPFKDPQSEILSRISPNIYDVMIAFSGGLVGVIAITRVQKGNPIPGVAIATALMPPLCTAGFGLATGNFRFFFGAMFLYTINCVFIGIATFAIVKFLKYPAAKFVDRKQEKRVQHIVYLITVLILLPSIYFAFSLYREQNFKQLSEQFINDEFVSKGAILVYKKTDYNSKPKIIEVAFLQKNYNQKEVQQISRKLPSFGLPDTKLVIKENSAANFKKLRDDILNEVGKTGSLPTVKEQAGAALELQIAEKSLQSRQLFTEASAIMPGLVSLGISEQHVARKDTVTLNKTVIIRSQEAMGKDSQDILLKWLQARLNSERITVLFTEEATVE